MNYTNFTIKLEFSDIKFYFKKYYRFLRCSKPIYMSLRKLLPLLLVTIFASTSAQNRVFSYSQVQSRNSVQEWGKAQSVGQQSVHFSCEAIDLKIDENYHLTIVSKTDLPDNGAIYLCNDERSNPVTIMLIDDNKMFVYSKTKRYQIKFEKMQSMHILADTD